MVRFRMFGGIFSKENSSMLLFSSEVSVPRTLQILFGKRFTSEAIAMKFSSSFRGMITAKIPSSESRSEALSINSSKGSASLNRANSREEEIIVSPFGGDAEGRGGE